MPEAPFEQHITDKERPILRAGPQRNTIFTLGLLAAIPALAISMALSVPEQLAVEFSVDAEIARLFVTLYLAGYAAALIPMGICCDVFPRKWFVLGCLLGFATLGVSALVANSLFMILLTRFIQGVLGAACAVGARAIVTDIAGVDSTKSMASMMTILALAPCIGPLIGGQALAWVGYIGPLLALSIYAALTAIMLISLVPDITKAGHAKRRGLGVSVQVRQLVAERNVTVALALICIPFAGYLVMISGLSEMASSRYGYSAATFGSTLATLALAYPISALIGRQLLNFWNAIRVMACGVVLFLVSLCFQIGYLVSVQPHEVILWTAVCFYLGGLGFVIPLATAAVMDAAASNTGFSAAVIGTAQFTLGSLGSALYAFFSDGHGTFLLATMAFAVVMTTFSFARFVALRKDAREHCIS